MKHVAERQIEKVSSLDEGAFYRYLREFQDELARDNTLSDVQWMLLIGIRVSDEISAERKLAVSRLMRNLTAESTYFHPQNRPGVIRTWLEDPKASMSFEQKEFFQERCATICPDTWLRVCKVVGPIEID